MAHGRRIGFFLLFGEQCLHRDPSEILRGRRQHHGFLFGRFLFYGCKGFDHAFNRFFMYRFVNDNRRIDRGFVDDRYRYVHRFRGYRFLL